MNQTSLAWQNTSELLVSLYFGVAFLLVSQLETMDTKVSMQIASFVIDFILHSHKSVVDKRKQFRCWAQGSQCVFFTNSF